MDVHLVVEERLLAQGRLGFGLGTLPNIRFRQCFQDQILHTNYGRNYRIQGYSGPAYANWLESFVERGR